MPDSPLRSFKYDGQVFDIPETKVQDFLKDIPDAEEIRSYTVGKDTFDIPLPKVSEFLKDASDAKPLHDYPNIDFEGGVEENYTKPAPGVINKNETDYGPFDKETVEKYPQARQNFERWQEEQNKEPGFLGKLSKTVGNEFMTGLNQLNSWVADAPALIYDLAGAPFRAVGLNVPKAEDFKDGALEQVSDYYKKNAEAYEKRVNEINPEREQGVVNAFQNGNIGTGIINLAGSISESMPASIALMLSGGATTPTILGSAAVFGAGKAQEMDENSPEMNYDKRKLISAVNGTLEGVFETWLGSGAVGKSLANIIKKEGKDVAGKEIKKSFSTVFADMITKNPWLAPMGEGFEEIGTQLTQNIVDKYSGYQPELKITDGVGDAFLAGVGMGGIHGSVIGLAKKAFEEKPLPSGENVTPDNPVEPDKRQEFANQVQKTISSRLHEDGTYTTIVDNNGKEWQVKTTTPGTKGEDYLVYDPESESGVRAISSEEVKEKPVIQTPEQVLETELLVFDQKQQESDEIAEQTVEFNGKTYINLGEAIEGEIGLQEVTENELGQMEPVNADPIQVPVEEFEAYQQAKAEQEIEQQVVQEPPKERPIVTQKIGNTSIDIVENEGFDEVIPTEKMPYEKILPLLEKKFAENKRFELQVDKSRVEIPGETKWDEPTYQTVIKSIKIVPKNQESRIKNQDNLATDENSQEVPEIVKNDSKEEKKLTKTESEGIENKETNETGIQKSSQKQEENSENNVQSLQKVEQETASTTGTGVADKTGESETADTGEAEVLSDKPDVQPELGESEVRSQKSEVLTPREAAIDLIKNYVKRGDSMESLSSGQQGSFNSRYNAQIGAYVNGKKISPRKIVVSQINGKEIPPEIFSIKELYDEIKSTDKENLTVEQIQQKTPVKTKPKKKFLDERIDPTLAKLRTLGFSEEQINKLSPADELRITNENISPEQFYGVAEKVKQAETKVNTNPTEAQKKAGNYKMGHVRFSGFDITIENPQGSVRSGTDSDGEKWEQEMNNTYGYFKRTKGKDGDQVDVFLGSNPYSKRVFVVDQIDPKTALFDEHKVMLGFNTEQEAKDAYLSNYNDNWTGLGAITEMSKKEFRKWLKQSESKTGKKRKPVSELVPFKKKKSKSLSPEEIQERKAQRIQALTIEPLTLEQLIMQYVISGNRLNYAEIKKELFPRSKSEMDSRIWMLSGKVPTIDELLVKEGIVSGTQFEEKAKEPNVFRNAVLEVVLRHSTMHDMVQSVLETGSDELSYEKAEQEYGEMLQAMEEDYQNELEDFWNLYVENLPEISENELNELFLQSYGTEETQNRIERTDEPNREEPGNEERGKRTGSSEETESSGQSEEEKLKQLESDLKKAQSAYNQAQSKYTKLNKRLKDSPEFGNKGQSDIFGEVAGSDALDFGNDLTEARKAVKNAKDVADKAGEEVNRINKLIENLKKSIGQKELFEQPKFLDERLNNDNLVKNKGNEIPEQISQGEQPTQDEANSQLERFSDYLRNRNAAAETERGSRSQNERREEESRITLEYAKENGLWIRDIYDLGQPFSSGNESTNVVDVDSRVVYKSNNLMNSGDISTLLEQLKIHNQLFPETKYDLVGFTGIDNGATRPPTIEVILKQQLIGSTIPATESEIKSFMENLGFKPTGKLAEFSNGEFIVSDLHPRNVLKDENGDLYVIDNIIRPIESNKNQIKTPLEEKLAEAEKDISEGNSTKERLQKRSAKVSLDKINEDGFMWAADPEAVAKKINEYTDAEVVVDKEEGVIKLKPTVTDQAEVQELKNSIREGESILKSGKKTNGDYYSQEELETVRKSIINSKKKIGEVSQTPKAEFKGKTKPQDQPVTWVPEDVDYKRAYNAYSGSSFSPEKRAKSEQTGFVNDMNTLLEEFSKIAKSPEQVKVMWEQLAKYKDGYLKKLNALLDAQSRTLSSMITGPANFPTARNQKALNVVDKRRTEFLEYVERARKNAIKAIKNAATPEQKEDEAWNSIKKELTSSAATIVGIDKGIEKGYNRSLFVNSISGLIKRMFKNGQYNHVIKSLDYIDELNEKYDKPIISSRSKIWDLREQSEKALNEQESAPEQDNTPETIYETDEVSVVNNKEQERVQIVNSDIPPVEIRNKLKSSGFRWSPKNKAWQRKNTPEGIRIAEKFAKENYPKEENGKTILYNKSKLLTDRLENTVSGVNRFYNTTKEMADRYSKQFGVKINVARNENDLPPELKVEVTKVSDGYVFGFYDTSSEQLWLLSNNLRGNKSKIEETILHETIGHYGLRNLLGKRFNPVLESVWNSMDEATQNQLKKDYDSDDIYLLTDEYLAELAEGNVKPAWWNTILSTIREWLRKVFPNIKMTVKDIESLLAKSRKNLEKKVKSQPSKFLDERLEGSKKAEAKSQTETPEFKKWFGNSKVVDENGKPLVVYHGTPNDFNTFRIDLSEDGEQTGIWFTDNKSEAERYSDGWFDESKGKGFVKDAYLSIHKPFIIGENNDVDIEDIESDAYNEEKINELKDKGYDGMVGQYYEGDNPSNKVYVVFEPTQIKSATGNQGTFDTNNPDIRFRMGNIVNNDIRNKFKNMSKDELVEYANSNAPKGVAKYEIAKNGRIYQDYGSMFGKSYYTVDELKSKLTNSEISKIVNNNNTKIKEWLQKNNFQKQYVSKSGTSSYWNNGIVDVRVSDHYLQSQYHDLSSVNSYTEKEEGHKNVIKQIEEIIKEYKKEEPTSASLSTGTEAPIKSEKSESENVGTKLTSYHNVNSDSNVENNSEKENTLRFKKGKFLNDRLDKAAEAYEYKKQKQTFKESVQKIREFWQDINLPIRKLEETIKERGGRIYNRSKPYRDINLSFGRMEELYNRFTEDKMKPILEAVSDLVKSGVDKTYVLPYIISKHAVERNREMRIAEYDRWIEANEDATTEEREAYLDKLGEKDYSGVRGFAPDVEYKDPDVLAQEIVDEFESKVDKDKLDALWNKINNATNEILEHWLKGGQISYKQYEQYKKQYKHFVPLRGWRQGAAKDLRYQKGQGFGGSLRHAEGRKSLAENPLAYMQAVAFKSIGERVDNEIKNSLLNLVLTNYKPEFRDLYHIKKVYYLKSEMFNTETGEMEEVWEPTLVKPPEHYFSKGDAKSEYYGQHMKLRSKFEGFQHEVIVHREGGDVAIVFDNEMLPVAQAFNRQNTMFSLFGSIEDATTWNMISRTWPARVTQFMKQMFTSSNPVFPFTNFFRDVPEAAVTLWVQDQNPNVMKNIPKAMKAIRSKLWGTPDTRNKIQQELKSFYEVGGATGFTHEKTPEQIEKDLQKELKRMLHSEGLKGKSVNTVSKVFQAIQKWNQLFEDTTRFAVYLSSREAGKSIEDSAMDAKEASVNFNRKGKGTKMLDSIWAFFNPAIQAAQKNFKLAKDHPGRFGAVALGVTMAGFIEALLNDLGDDDEYYRLNDYVRHNYAVIGVPGEKYIRIPLPQFWRGFHSLGVITYDLIKGKTEPGKAVSNTTLNFIGGLSPIDIPGFWVDGEFSLTPIVPSFAKPPVEAYITNRDFMQNTIALEPFTKALEEQLADSDLHKKNVNPAIKAVTDFLSKDIGGKYGNLKVDVRDGKIKRLNPLLDLNPSKIEHIITSYTGGTGKVVSDLVTTLTQFASADEEVDINNIPFINSFLRNTPAKKWEVIGEYYDLKDLAGDVNAVKSYAKTNKDFEKYKDVSVSDLNAVATIIKIYDKSITDVIEKVGMQSEEGTEKVVDLMQKAVDSANKILEQ